MVDFPDRRAALSDLVSLVSKALAIADEHNEVMLGAKLDECLAIAVEREKSVRKSR